MHLTAPLIRSLVPGFVNASRFVVADIQQKPIKRAIPAGKKRSLKRALPSRCKSSKHDAYGGEGASGHGELETRAKQRAETNLPNLESGGFDPRIS
jgi:hypothetical protein